MSRVTGSAGYSDDEDDLLDKELDAFIEEKTEEKTTVTKKEEDTYEPPKNFSDSEGEMEKEEKGQRETAGDGDKEKSTDDEWDEQELSEDQKRAMEELENLRNMDDLPPEDPPEYDVTARVKQLNEELANDTTPTDKKRESRVLFKEDLVDLVAPPPDYGEGEENSPKNQDGSSTPEHSETIKSNSGTKKSDEKVLLERGGNFEYVSADEVTADDMGIPLFDNDKENMEDNHGAGDKNYNSNNNNNSSFNRKPAPPSNPRPSTATGASRRSVRPAPKARAQSAGSRNSSINYSVLENFNYKSPYALSEREKELLLQQNKQKEEQKRDAERQKKKDEQEKQSYNDDLFQSWLSKIRQREKSRREKEEEEKKKNQKPDKRRSKQKNKSQDELKDDDDTDDDDDNDETEENRVDFKAWVQTKTEQQKREKLLKKRQEQEANEGLIIRSREDCDKAFRDWLRRKNTDLKRARAAEKQKARMMRIAARKARKTQALTKAIRQSNAFRYVDYYGYRF